jgi:hypothetical protein
MREILKRKKPIMSEKDTITSILKLAREQGVEEKVKNLIIRFQEAVKNAKTDLERQQIATLGIAEIHKTIGCVGNLVVDGIEILPADSSYQEAIDAHKRCVKLD